VELKAGARVQSVVCETQAIVVKAPSADVDLRCGGQPMVPIGTETAGGSSPDAAHSGGTLLGKRYSDEAIGLEVLCTKAGQGSLSVGDTALAIKEAKPLPSSD
jgi:hypothetical protein